MQTQGLHDLAKLAAGAKSRAPPPRSYPPRWPGVKNQLSNVPARGKAKSSRSLLNPPRHIALAPRSNLVSYSAHERVRAPALYV